MIIGLLGRVGSGKSTAARHIAARADRGKVFALADLLKRIARDVLDFSDEQLWGSQEIKEFVDARYGFSARWFLQKLATEGIRRHLGQDVWVEALLRDVRAWWLDIGRERALAAQVGREIGPMIAVVEDVRFRNEVRALRAAGGKILKLVRSDVVPVRGMVGDEVLGRAEEHQSEAEVDLVPDSMLDVTVWSAPSPGSTDLKEKVDRVLRSWGLIGPKGE